MRLTFAVRKAWWCQWMCDVEANVCSETLLEIPCLQMYGCLHCLSVCMCGCVADLAIGVVPKMSLCWHQSQNSHHVSQQMYADVSGVKNTEHFTAHLTYCIYAGVIIRMYTYCILRIHTYYRCHHTYCFYVALRELRLETVMFSAVGLMLFLGLPLCCWP